MLKGSTVEKGMPDLARLEVPIEGGAIKDAYDFTESSCGDLREEDLTDDEEKERKRPRISVFAPDLVIMHDKYAFKYLVTDNRRLKPISLVRILQKGGKYILNMGIVQIFEMLILNMFLVIYSYKMEAELITDMQEKGKSDTSITQGIPKSISTPYILAHQYVMF